ncbi:Antitoxin CptB [Candidatus Providencia siddallii]|uniref:FAD assembly factor SdhE n=1 Tax=Candidatus Providencia siddallii TaxID=1715285 RepID=A0A0M6W7B7_9GAMM|nr:Antitoxin CptB [Candidatus Providencia siddallii]
MNIKNKKQIYWACRRGIRELEILITTFFENKYDNLTNNDKYAFIRFLNYDDRSMINLLINTNLIDKKKLRTI